MDIVAHAIAGAVTGAAFGWPVTGALVGIAPDLVLGVRRKEHPPIAYRVTHSVLVLCTVAAGLVTFSPLPGLAATVYYAWLSHLVLDLFTHGYTWAVRPLYPLLEQPVIVLQEWEFFNASYLRGLLVTVVWCLVWFAIGVLV